MTSEDVNCFNDRRSEETNLSRDFLPNNSAHKYASKPLYRTFFNFYEIFFFTKKRNVSINYSKSPPILNLFSSSRVINVRTDGRIGSF